MPPEKEDVYANAVKLHDLEESLKQCCKSCFQLGKSCFQIAWHCTQFWTTLSISTIIVWLIYRPHRFYPTVDPGILYAFNLTAPGNATGQLPSLRYNLAVDISLRNSHRGLKLQYLDIGATAFYNGTRLGPANDTLPAPFRQGPKNTTIRRVLHPTFQGTLAAVDSSMAAELERELAAGTVHVRVSISLTIKYKVWLIKHISFYKYDCWLWFPLPHVNAPAIFHDAGTRCWLDK
ncbi:unnamed protein product [Urochloa decumbens]|uniref:Late embryogenesis abundant protein LEA-2 subgroup domain-containing protein n=1 Tax=Urochloa decumbens TaxID=240449 RepID=A0ABC9AI81_9POAL